MRLVDVDAVKKKYPLMENDFGMTFNEGLHKAIDSMPTVEAIPKADYEARLKADKVAMLEEIKEQLREMHDDLFELANFAKANGVSDSMDVIKKKINKLKENKVANKLRASGQIQDKDRYISMNLRHQS